ncbi:MAG: hypothetical protein J5U19_13705 [Candidatus Methanoperedens sp.]|nr:hypothetical protein [Candidatus Methanoperedens sp.]
MKKQTTEENPAAAEGKQLRNKATICATVSPWLKRKLEALVDEGDDFASVSDIVSLACHEFLIRHFPDVASEKPTATEKNTKSK